MIAGDIRSRLFGGSISKYWTECYSLQQSNPRQTPSTLRQSQEQRARQWVNQTIQQLPDLPRQMLQRCAVFRRPVAESFYLQMLEDASDADRTAALTTLKSLNLVEDIDIQSGQVLIQQHNLIRDSAYAQLKANPSTWETAERTAAHLWRTAYTAPSNAERIETVRGYLEAFNHYCEVEDWERASEIYTAQVEFINQPLRLQLFMWGNYQTLIQISARLSNKAVLSTRIKCFLDLGNSYSCLGNQNMAIDNYQRILTVAREIGDRQSEGIALGSLGITYNSLGQYKQAIAQQNRLLSVVERLAIARVKAMR